MSNILFLDTETFSEVDIRKAGGAKYARDPSTEILMLTWALNDGPVHYEDLTAAPITYVVRSLIENHSVVKVAHNAPFDKDILEHCLGIKTLWSAWKCSQALAYSLGFTGSLGDIQDALGFAEDLAKIKEGKTLIRRFSMPQPKNHKVRRWTRENDPEGWQKFGDYAIRDTASMRDMWRMLEGYRSMSEFEWDVWRSTNEMNDRGIPIDPTLVDNAIDMVDQSKDILKGQMLSITGLENPCSNHQLTEWLTSRGLRMPNMQAATVDNMLKTMPDSTTKDVLRMKRTISQTAVTKWSSVKAMLCSDNTVKGQFQYRGASRTGRDASRGINLQNLRRPPKGDMDRLVDYIYKGDVALLDLVYGTPLEFLAGTVRGAITAPEGAMLVVSDLSSIESRVLGWLSGCVRMNNIFAEGKDTYKDFAVELFNTDYESVTKDQRTFSKPPVLGAGYMMGARGLAAYAESMGTIMTEDEAKHAVDTFRNVYHEIPALWTWIMQALEYVLTSGQSIQGYYMAIYLERDYLFILLPSGRPIAYYKPVWQMWLTPVGDRMSFTYMGVNRFKPQPTWERVAAHAGGVVENIIQAVARDILMHWVYKVNPYSSIVGRVHDEIIIVEQENTAKEMLDKVNHEISKGVVWAPGLLLAAEGFVAKHYTKD